MGLPWLSKFIKSYKTLLTETGIIIPVPPDPAVVIIDASGVLCQLISGVVPSRPNISYE